MKKTVTTLVFMFVLTFVIQAQKKACGTHFKKLSTAQQTALAVKKMTLKLDLTESQQKDIKPLLEQQITARKEMYKKRKALKGNNEKITAKESYAMLSEKLDKQIAFKNNMKNILNKEQYARFEKHIGQKMRKRKLRME